MNRKFGQPHNPKLPVWTREELVKLALRLQLGNGPLRDNGNGTIDILCPHSRNGHIVRDYCARIHLSYNGDQRHRLLIPELAKKRFRYVDSHIGWRGRAAWTGGLNRCLNCSMTYFKSAVAEAYYGMASKRPVDWMCGHDHSFLCIDQEDLSRLVDVLLCLNCSRFHYLFYATKSKFRDGGREFKLLDSLVNSGDIVCKYENLANLIERVLCIIPRVLVGMITDFLLPRDGTFVSPNASTESTKSIETTDSKWDNGHVVLGDNGEIVFLDHCNVSGNQGRRRVTPIRFVFDRQDRDRGRSLDVVGYQVDDCKWDFPSVPEREESSNFGIVGGTVDGNGNILICG